MRAAPTRAASRRTYPLSLISAGTARAVPWPVPEDGEGRDGRGRGAPYFRYPAPRELRAAGLYAREVRNSQGLLGDGLDVRGEGGYVVVPPSSTARAYRWIDRAPPASAAWLLGCLRAAPSGETLF
jgi:hypothetical protein